MDYKALFDLSGKRALVVGGGSGIGSASSEGLASFGAEVICADIDLVSAQRCADQIVESGGLASAYRLDITDKTQIDEAVKSHGRIDIVVLTSAINVRKRLLELTEDEFDRVVEVNLKGNFRLMRAFGAQMAKSGGGSLIAFSSIRAQVVEPGQGVYSATKAGVLQLMRTLAAELGPDGVRANVIAPGVVETPLTAPIRANESWYEAYRTKTILGRWADASEMVGAVIFLASQASSYVTGSYLVVDGGWLAADGRFTPPS